jgi:hypothetical protein
MLCDIKIINVDRSIKKFFLDYIRIDKKNKKEICEEDSKISKTNYFTNAYDKKLVNLYYKHLDFYIKESIKTKHHMNCIWYQIYNSLSDSYHGYHTHNREDCHISGVYFLKLKDHSISTEFIIDDIPKQFNVDEGDVILFDSSISHRSPPNNTSNDKIIISFNINCYS